ncbi:type II toxin-antitoxin system Phd/YefM family antitoxin [Bifidobacterium crudilactis]|uniref:type II toxin-antitoxin system Phd/YefM family antitoxin n=1 Tax=Bifidobacterium crudilactis TaxID=327277 RepID=UPI002353F393|nr:type II toxin-antitoxin system Phd/YefM family antitoxin [Bifidobacterium crudilactis]MCI2148685.1 type II toxin-antitoxin system Phd/YefM family antitoxin [Bifidobacterium crudilactis]MCI2157778.1 type II toxin-antitoxin system Phd/YefM family antitoxin [Bifidobacterium crudilactis]
METINSTNARKTLFGLIDQVNEESQPYTIVGKRGNAVLIGEDDWRSMQETLYLSSIPDMNASILKALDEKLEDGSTEIEW